MTNAYYVFIDFIFLKLLTPLFGYKIFRQKITYKAFSDPSDARGCLNISIFLFMQDLIFIYNL